MEISENSKIDVFFKFLENSKSKNRDVSFYSKCITIWANETEGRGMIAKIEITENTRHENCGFLNLFSKKVEENKISGYFVDVKTKDRYHFHINDTENSFKLYYDKIISAISEHNINEKALRNENYEKLLKREL